MRSIISFILLSLCAMVCAIQIRHSALRNTQWQIVVNEGNDTIGHDLICFTDSTYSQYAIYMSTGMINSVNSLPYYLSDTMVTRFDDALVGKETQGQYLILKTSNSNIPQCLFTEIMPQGHFRMI